MALFLASYWAFYPADQLLAGGDARPIISNEAGDARVHLAETGGNEPVVGHVRLDGRILLALNAIAIFADRA